MSESFLTPVLFLIFNRPDVTQKVFDQIKNIKPKYLYVAADGPRSERPDEYRLCQETRKIIREVDWECDVITLFRDENLGCGIAVSSAITWFFEQVEYGIILEDDCFPDLSFFTYCQDLLIKYKDDEQIMLIGGNNFQNGIQRGDASYYFSYYPHIWGWATWQRAWQNYDFDMKDFDTNFDSSTKGILNSQKEKQYWKKIATKVSNGKINTWDYQWVFTIWKNNGFSITPNCNLVVNLGFRGSSTHTFLKDSYKENMHSESMVYPMKYPQKIVDKVADKVTFENVYGLSLKRILRLFNENNLFFLMKYSIKKLFQFQ